MGTRGAQDKEPAGPSCLPVRLGCGAQGGSEHWAAAGITGTAWKVPVHSGIRGWRQVLVGRAARGGTNKSSVKSVQKWCRGPGGC